MPVEIKFCGMTRTRDVEAALHQGAAYVGVIMAGGPRNLALRDAVATLAPAKGRAKRVAVVGPGPAEQIAEVAGQFDVVQLHGGVTTAHVQSLRELFSGEIWSVVAIDSVGLPREAFGLFGVSDAVVFDRKSESGLGGTGQRLDWAALAKSLEADKPARIVLAGGLSPLNVEEAITTVHPDIVDVSSGVESVPGIKDRDLLRAFARAVRGTEALQ